MANERKLKRYWSLANQQKFFSRFTELIDHGFSISDALEVMSVLFRSSLIQLMISSCQNGIPFAETLEASSFDKRTIYIIRCSEESGSLLQGLRKAGNYSQHHYQNQKELQKKLRYPSFLFFIMLIILSTIYLFFLPQMDTFYNSFNIKSNHTAIESVILMIGVAFFSITILMSLMILIIKFNHLQFQKIVKKWLFHCFGLRHLAQKLFSYYFSSQWLLLLECGLPLKESLSTIQSFERITLIRLIVHELKQRLESGESLEAVINSSSYFTPYYKLIMTHALKIGCTQSELTHYTASELANLNELMTNFFKVFQTSLLALIGSIIILLYMSILQPVFEMVELL